MNYMLTESALYIIRLEIFILALNNSSPVRRSGWKLSRIFDLDVENCLIGFEDHACVHFKVFVQVEPSTIGARLVVDTIDEPPRSLIRGELNVRLVLGQELVVDADVAIRCPSNNDFLAREVLLVVVDLTCWRSAKDFKLELDWRIVCVDVQIFRNM